MVDRVHEWGPGSTPRQKTKGACKQKTYKAPTTPPALCSAVLMRLGQNLEGGGVALWLLVSFN